MKHCNNCNSDFPDNISFCTKCGSQLVDKVFVVSSANEITDPQKTEKTKKKTGKIFKRILLGLVAIIVILFLWGAHLMNATSYLVLNSQGELFAKNGGVAEVNIDYDGYIWEVTYKPSWIDIDEFDNSFKIKCKANDTKFDREDHVTIKSGKILQALPVAQYGEAQYIRLSETGISSDIDGGSIYIDMQTDGIGPEIAYPEFCEIEDLDDYGFTLRVKSNNEFSRSGTIEVSEDNVSAYIRIAQKGKCSDCGGQGEKPCPACGGLGSSAWGWASMNCFTCGGNGTINCFACNGTGIR